LYRQLHTESIQFHDHVGCHMTVFSYRKYCFVYYLWFKLLCLEVDGVVILQTTNCFTYVEESGNMITHSLKC
jgi:hypothetical protein